MVLCHAFACFPQGWPCLNLSPAPSSLSWHSPAWLFHPQRPSLSLLSSCPASINPLFQCPSTTSVGEPSQNLSQTLPHLHSSVTYSSSSTPPLFLLLLIFDTSRCTSSTLSLSPPLQSALSYLSITLSTPVNPFPRSGRRPCGNQSIYPLSLYNQLTSPIWVEASGGAEFMTSSLGEGWKQQNPPGFKLLARTLCRVEGVKSNVRTFESLAADYSVCLDVTLLLFLTTSRNFLACEVPSHSNDEPGLGGGRVVCEGGGQRVVVCWRTAGEEPSPSSERTSGDSEGLCGGRRSQLSSSQRTQAHYYEA